MRRSQRIKQLHEILLEKRNASTQYLCTVLDCSESSVRRDIKYLASTNPSVRRVHGGALIVDSRDELEYMFELKLKQNLSFKRRIASATIELVEDGDSVIIDSGTTCLYAGMELHKKRHLRVVALDVRIAQELAKSESIDTIVVGGLIRPGYYAIGGTLAEEMINSFKADKIIMSADAIDLESGITNYSLFEVGVKKRIIGRGGEVIVIADHTKFGKTSFYKVADLREISTIVTNHELDPVYSEQIKELGIRVITC